MPAEHAAGRQGIAVDVLHLLLMVKVSCFHCGEDCLEGTIVHDGKSFCCSGCKLVYDILKDNKLGKYYTLQGSPGITPPGTSHSRYAYLDNEDVAEKLIRYRDDARTLVSFTIPQMHCSSCIWLLENMFRLNPFIHSSRVNFLRKEVQISFAHNELSLRQLVELLASIGYAPEINLSKLDGRRKKVEKGLIYQIGVAGFAFFNIMLISLPDYFGLDQVRESRFAEFFGYVSLLLSVPVLVYSAGSYFRSAWNGLRHRNINIDGPISLGILTLFTRSLYEIVFSAGSGYLDSMSGLVFFLLLGKAFQQVTYNTISFDRDYKSYFPIAVTRVSDEGEEDQVSVSELNTGDQLLIRNNELIPVDTVLVEGRASIDNSFVTGESYLLDKAPGEKIFAGGKQVGAAIRVRVIRKLSQSYLMQLWNNEAFTEQQQEQFEGITNRMSKYFTLIVLGIALASGAYWYGRDFAMALNAFTAVLIIACPCALALSAPFTFGNVLRILGKQKFYLRNAGAIEALAKTDTAVLDKTGTITRSTESQVSYEGTILNDEETNAVAAILHQSSHPLSAIIFEHLGRHSPAGVKGFEEITGQGIIGESGACTVRIGNRALTGAPGDAGSGLASQVHLAINDEYRGYFLVRNKYRKGLKDMLLGLRQWYSFSLLTGDNDSERHKLSAFFGQDDILLFGQTPDDKLRYVRELQEEGKRVLMIGDGLNDAGALKQSDAGIVVSDDVNTFSPSCDGIIDADAFQKLPAFIKLCRQSIKVVIASFVLSFVYNIVGLAFAVSGTLSPVVAAILMPLSSITVVIFVTLLTNSFAAAKNLK